MAAFLDAFPETTQIDFKPAFAQAPLAVAVFAAWQIQDTYDIVQIAVPFVGPVAIAPWAYIAFAAFAIVAMVSVNSKYVSEGMIR